MIALKPKKGHLLIAEPSIIGDVSFNRSVVLLAEHNKQGSIGFILNKPLSFRLNDIVPGVDRPLKVYNGGPVEQDNLYFIHKVPKLIANSIEISNGIYWGGDFEVIIELINSGEIRSVDIKFFLGYAGWQVAQLEKELESNSWIISENTHKTSVIRKASASFWKEKMVEFGGDYLLWSNAPENPNLN
ncbi:YqgE/AlgH family protein [Sinomicrobium sp.]